MNKTNMLGTGTAIAGVPATISLTEARWRLGIPRDAVMALAHERGACVDGRVVIDSFRGANVPCPTPALTIVERLLV